MICFKWHLFPTVDLAVGHGEQRLLGKHDIRYFVVMSLVLTNRIERLFDLEEGPVQLLRHPVGT